MFVDPPPEGKIDWGIGVNLTVRLKRLPRQRCTWCSLRRVCFVLTVEDVVQGPPMCAIHAGIRS